MLLAEASSAKLSRTDPKCLEGEFASFDTLNQNNRVYPRDLYEEALNKLMPKVKAKSCLGECDHPLDYDEVRLSNVSHVITEINVQGDKVYGKVELLNTPSGKIVECLVEAGIPIGISSRAVGDVREVDGHEEVTSLDIITYDLVADPSFKDAILSETTKSKLGESLSRIEKTLPLRESCGGNDVRKTIKRIRESLLTDSSERVSNRSSNQAVVIEAMSKVVREKTQKLSKMKSRHKSLVEENKSLMSENASISKKLAHSQESLKGLMGNMTKLQESYNGLVETTVSRDSYAKLEEETVELRKRLEVESRGMTYSQVRGILEGATTTEEIDKRLDSIKTSRSSGLSEIEKSRSMLEAARVAPATSKSKRLSELISRV